MTDSHIIERAYEIARAGVAQNLSELERRLKSEGYSSVSQHLAGPSLRKELAKLIKAALPREAIQQSVAADGEGNDARFASWSSQ
jgi:hypothetical protein